MVESGYFHFGNNHSEWRNFAEKRSERWLFALAALYARGYTVSMITKAISMIALAALAVPALCAEGETAFQRDLLKQYAQGLIQEKGTAAFAEIVAF